MSFRASPSSRLLPLSPAPSPRAGESVRSLSPWWWWAAGGQVVTVQRDDGCGTLRIHIAQGKARGALGMGIPPRAIRDRLENRPVFQSAVATASRGQFIPVPGGVLILDREGRAIGAVGVSGDTSDRDEYCAIEGIRAAGLASDPPEPAPDWRASSL